MVQDNVVVNRHKDILNINSSKMSPMMTYLILSRMCFTVDSFNFCL